MPKTQKQQRSRIIRRTREEEIKSAERSAIVRAQMLEQRATRTEVAAQLGIDVTTLWRRLKRGLSEREFLDALAAIGAVRAAQAAQKGR